MHTTTPTSKLAFVIERYGVEMPMQSSRRTRALAAALADRGHDVTVLTTCARTDSWHNQLLEGESHLDRVRVVRFVVSAARKRATERIALGLIPLDPRSDNFWVNAHGPESTQLIEHLRHSGGSYDAVFFTGEWGWLVREGIGRVETAVLAPPPEDDPSRHLPHSLALVQRCRAVALASRAERDAVSAEIGCPLPDATFVIGACSDPSEAESQLPAHPPVAGPFIVHIGARGAHADTLARSFRAFRDAHTLTPFEDDAGAAFEGRDLRLVFAGDFGLPHDPEARILCLGPVDDHVRVALLRSTLSMVHSDPRDRLPISLIEAWTLGRATILDSPHAVLRALAPHIAAEYTCTAATFGSCLASLLSRAAPRNTFGARVRAHARRMWTAGHAVSAVESCLRALRTGR